MKRLLFIVFAVMMVVAPLSTVNAINLDQDSPHILAEVMPEGVDFFAGTRIGEDFIAELDAISLALYDKLPPMLGVESYELGAVLRQTFAEEGLDYDAIAAAYGDYAAIGLEINGSMNDDPNVYFVMDIDDQQAAESEFIGMLPNPEQLPEPVKDGDNVIYSDPEDNIMAIFTPTHFILTNVLDYGVPVDAPLSANADFTGALGMLPADVYNIVGYVSVNFVQTVIAESDSSGDMSMLGVDPADAGYASFGATIQSGDTFTLDFAYLSIASAPSSTVNVDVLNALPAGTDAFIMGADLTSVYNNSIEAIQTATAASGEDDPTAQIPMMFGMTGLNLEEDVLSWTTGTYGIFFGTDYPALLNDVSENGTLTDINLDFGIVIEATDPELAQNAADNLGEFMMAMGGNEEGVTITSEDGLTSIMLELPIDPMSAPMMLEIVLTATDDFLFLGTRQSYDAVVNGETLAGVEDFTQSTQYYLGDATSVWYANADGFLSTTVVPLALLGPAIGNIFDNIVAELNGSDPGEPADTNPLNMITSGGDMSPVIEILEAFDSMFAHSTISSSIDDAGVIRFRATMTVNP